MPVYHFACLHRFNVMVELIETGNVYTLYCVDLKELQCPHCSEIIEPDAWETYGTEIDYQRMLQAGELAFLID